jgi:hypothetical protein
MAHLLKLRHFAFFFGLSTGMAIAQPQACFTGSVSLAGGVWTWPGGTAPAATAQLQEIPIIPGLTGAQRYTRILASEDTQFTGPGITATAVSIGRPGATTDDELLPQTPFMVSGGSAWFSEDHPNTPILGANPYTLVLAIRTTGGNVAALTAGVVNYEVCGYSMGTPATIPPPPAVTPPPVVTPPPPNPPPATGMVTVGSLRCSLRLSTATTVETFCSTASATVFDSTSTISDGIVAEVSFQLGIDSIWWSLLSSGGKVSYTAGSGFASLATGALTLPVAGLTGPGCALLPGDGQFGWTASYDGGPGMTCASVWSAGDGAWLGCCG